MPFAFAGRMQEAHGSDPGSQYTIELGPDGRIASIDGPAAALLGADPERVHGAPVASVFAEPPDVSLRAVFSAARSASPTWFSARLKTVAGATRCLVRAVPLLGRDAAGRLRLELTPGQVEFGR